MPRAGQTRLGWDRFDGGIQQAPERAQPGQVLDARNIWAPDGLPERRPGSRYIAAGNDIETRNPTNVTLTNVDNGDGTFTYTLTIVAGIVGFPLPTTDYKMIFLSFPRVGDSVDGPFIQWTQTSGPPADKMVYDVDRVYTGTWNTGTAAVQGGGTYYFASPATPFLLAEVELGGSKRLLMVYEWFSGAECRATIDLPYNWSQIRSSYDLTIDGVTPTSSRISTYVEIPSLDKILVTYDKRIFEISTPVRGGDISPPSFDPADYGDATIRPAVVSTDPDLVGPRQFDDMGNVVTPPYSVDVLAQLSTPPRAGILVYFSGHVFAMDMPDEPFNVRWMASTLLSGYSIWPAVNFEPLDEDGGRPTGGKPLHEFLVVYQEQNIYVFILDSADSITGQATFDPKRVVSGVGSLSHNGIVEVQGKHFFPALDGFYAFNGTPDVAKLSERIDKFYRRLGVGALAQSRGVHWPEKHCVLWTIPQSAAPNPRELHEQQHYIILFDYTAQGGQGAWWVWDGVRGGGGLARMFAGNVVPGIYFMSSLAQIYRLTGNADIIDHNAQFLDATIPQVSDLPAAYILTHRLGEASFTTINAEEVWVEADTHSAQVGVTIIPSDDVTIEGLDKTLQITTAEDDITWGSTTWGGSEWRQNKRRSQYSGARGTGRFMQLKIYSVNALNRAWRFIKAALFVEKFGRR
jgi:hypothetical protein